MSRLTLEVPTHLADAVRWQHATEDIDPRFCLWSQLFSAARVIYSALWPLRVTRNPSLEHVELLLEEAKREADRMRNARERLRLQEHFTRILVDHIHATILLEEADRAKEASDA